MRDLRYLRSQARAILQTAAASTDDLGDVVLQRLPTDIGHVAADLAGQAQLTVPLERLTKVLSQAVKALVEADKSRTLIGSPLLSVARLVTGQDVDDGLIGAPEAHHAEARLRRGGRETAARFVAHLFEQQPVASPSNDKLAPPAMAMLLSDQKYRHVKLAVTPEGGRRFRFEFESVTVFGEMNDRGLLTARNRGRGPGLDPVVLVSMDAAKRSILLAHLPVGGYPPESFQFRW